MWEHNLKKFLLCFIPQGALQTKAMIHNSLSQGPPGEVPTVKNAVTTKVRSFEVWDACPVFGDIPDKVPELEMITWYGPSRCYLFFSIDDSWLTSGAALQGTLKSDFTEGEGVDRDKLAALWLPPLPMFLFTGETGLIAALLTDYFPSTRPLGADTDLFLPDWP